MVRRIELKAASSEPGTSDEGFLRPLLASCAANDSGRRSSLVSEIDERLASPTSKKSLMLEVSVEKNLLTLLRTIEQVPDPPALHGLLDVLEAYLLQGTATARSKRLKKLKRLDATSPLLRAMRTLLKGNGSMESVDRLSSVLLLVAVKDQKLPLKLRMGAVLTPIFDRIVTDHGQPWVSLLKLLCRGVRTARNAQLISRPPGNLEKIQQQIAGLQRDDEDRDDSASENLLLALARWLEIVFLLAKNRKARTHLAHHTTATLHDVWKQNLSTGSQSLPDIREEVCLVATGVLRLLVRNIKAKEKLMGLDTVRLCEQAIALTDEKGPKEAVAIELQESLCALCLRCMSTRPFPLPATATFPYTFSVASAAEQGRAVRASLAGARRPSTAAPGELEGSSTPSSEDEDEAEEDQFLNLLESRDLQKFVDESLDDGQHSHSEEEDAAAEKDLPAEYSRQKPAELFENYSSTFSEFRDGAVETEGEDLSFGHREAIKTEVRSTRSIIRFVKIAYPEFCGPDVALDMQPLQASSSALRSIVTQNRASSDFSRRVVYCIDELSDVHSGADRPAEQLMNIDEQRIGRPSPSISNLMFESRFESGNLRMATLVGPNHYELILSPDINQTRDHFQWFYFEISNNRANVPYTFEIINNLKTTSMFGKGMQPVMFSVTEATSGRPGWVRAGQQVHYYRNLYTIGNDDDENANEKPRALYTTRFSVSFRHAADVVYIAYHFPYTYSYMKTVLHRHLIRPRPSTSIRADVIGHSLAGNPIHVVTVTAPGTVEQLEKREIIFISSRVHPGESNSSWMMHGVLTALGNLDSQDLLSRFIFKLIPMLNPDGVINGSHRCSLAGCDMNRVWDRPSRSRHPEIYHAKGVIQYMVDVLAKPPFCVIDLHGHSKKANIFTFGNNPAESWRGTDRKDEALVERFADHNVLPEVLHKIAPGFSLKGCKYAIQKDKEPSARVALWRQFGLPRVYTMESTYCGFDTGKYRGQQIGVYELKEMGAKLVSAFPRLQKALARACSEGKENENSSDQKPSRKGRLSRSHSGKRRKSAQGRRDGSKQSIA